MTTTKSIWKTLSAIDCTKHVEKKGQFSYLSWTWAWAMVKERYPRAYYDLSDDIVYPDGTVEVRVRVGIPVDNESCALTHQMWLPVLNHQNKAIQNPDAFDINSARMRCLVKCLAMFGLGHYIYAGESLPQPQGLSDDEYEQFVAILAAHDGLGLIKYMEDLGEDKCNEAFNMAPKGQKVKFKEQVRECQKEGHAAIDEYALGLDSDDPIAVLELVAELTDDPWLKGKVWDRLSETTKHNVKTIIKERQP